MEWVARDADADVQDDECEHAAEEEAKSGMDLLAAVATQCDTEEQAAEPKPEVGQKRKRTETEENPPGAVPAKQPMKHNNHRPGGAPTSNVGVESTILQAKALLQANAHLQTLLLQGMRPNIWSTMQIPLMRAMLQSMAIPISPAPQGTLPRMPTSLPPQDLQQMARLAAHAMALMGQPPPPPTGRVLATYGA